MSGRGGKEKIEPILRAATGRNVLLLAGVLASLFFLVSSFVPSAGAPAMIATARGGVSAELPGIGDDPSAEKAADRGLFYSVYKVARNDTLSGIAESHGITLDTVVSFNNIQNARALMPGSLLKLPSISGILYRASANEDIAAIAAKHEISADRIIEANGLMSDKAGAGQVFFLPDARLASFQLREISGDLFRWPLRGWITTWYGRDKDPFTGLRRFHNGIDIGCSSGTPIAAPMAGYVADVGYSSGLGNYILVSHHGGWASLYGHLQSVSVKVGQRVAVGSRLGYSGNTGYSTGPHLHFSVFKYGKSVNPINVLH